MCPRVPKLTKIKPGNQRSQGFRPITDGKDFKMKMKINVPQGLEIYDFIFSDRRGIQNGKLNQSLTIFGPGPYTEKKHRTHYMLFVSECE